VPEQQLAALVGIELANEALELLAGAARVVALDVRQADTDRRLEIADTSEPPDQKRNTALRSSGTRATGTCSSRSASISPSAAGLGPASSALNALRCSVGADELERIAPRWLHGERGKPKVPRQIKLSALDRVTVADRGRDDWELRCLRVGMERELLPSFEDKHARDEALLAAIKQRLPDLEALLERFRSIEEDAVYRYYHQSFKVFSFLQPLIECARALFDQLAPTDAPLHPWFAAIREDALEHSFEMYHRRARRAGMSSAAANMFASSSSAGRAPPSQTPTDTCAALAAEPHLRDGRPVCVPAAGRSAIPGYGGPDEAAPPTSYAHAAPVALLRRPSGCRLSG
jgi:hypothetical protein